MAKWFRLHHEILNDPVVQMLTDKEFKVYINILCHASAIGQKGDIGSIEETAYVLRETKETVTSCFDTFLQKGLLVSNETDNETFHIPQWKKKQYISDSSTERVRKHREKKKRSKAVTVTPSDTDTDTDTDTDKKTTPANKFTEDDMKTAQWMFSRIQEMQPSRKEPNFDKWANTIRLIRERDKKTHKEICALYDKVSRDRFWRLNILCPDKLRERYDDLELKLSEENKQVAAPASQEAEGSFADKHNNHDWAEGLKTK